MFEHTMRAFGVSQWYQWYTNIVQSFTNGTIGNTICTNGNANGTIGLPTVPLATNGTIGKITNGTIGRTLNRALVFELLARYICQGNRTIVASKGPISLFEQGTNVCKRL